MEFVQFGNTGSIDTDFAALDHLAERRNRREALAAKSRTIPCTVEDIRRDYSASLVRLRPDMMAMSPETYEKIFARPGVSDEAVRRKLRAWTLRKRGCDGPA
jgi:hypothetical protein